ncbi:hypothetical protein DL766_006160 [Monosporascus sp. MC13-8B]|uniref:BTB domain-containing protein n=1 Tax=Monosporascus cannonballus TaxID=155416 RepID=A0ABY0HG99_9PEZI|nr:hypothetical protein DL762_002554 [Monosporascus cannonballus]RYO95199.1 hypothetical protein DL763_003767 [Monosporascus cannonballus]RYP27853.1 hypothetical protein DL766_006160 [Monosporascus sp. MC13-8B]
MNHRGINTPRRIYSVYPASAAIPSPKKTSQVKSKPRLPIQRPQIGMATASTEGKGVPSDGVGTFVGHDEKLLASGNLSDVEIRCRDKSWKLHKLILSSRCTWFDKALNGKFMEASSGVVTIENFEPDRVYQMIQFIYTGRLPCSDPDDKQFLPLIYLYELGDYFVLPELCEITLVQLKAKLDVAARLLQLAKLDNGYRDSDGYWRDDEYGAVNVTDEQKTTAAQHCKGFYEAVFFFSKTALYHMDTAAKGMEVLTGVPRFTIDVLMSGGLAIGLTHMRYPSACRECRNSLSSQVDHVYEKMGLEGGRGKFYVEAYCNSCAAKVS